MLQIRVLKKISFEWRLIFLLALLKLLIHLFTNTNYELHRDAFLYYSLGEHLAWGYTSVPPLIALFSKVSTLLFGNTVFALRLFPAIIGSLSVIVIARLVLELKGGNRALLIATLAFIFSPAFLRSNTLFQPVSFNQFFWLLSAYYIVKLINTLNHKFWLNIFIVFGVAFLNKYSITFFMLAFFLSLLISEHRVLLKSKYFFIGAGLALLIVSPNLLWQYNHNWPVMHHMAELQETQFVNVSVAGFLIDQLIMNFPGLLVWTSGLLFFLFSGRLKKYRLLGYIYLFTLLIILLLRGKSYYTLGLYPVLFAMGGVVIERYLKPYMSYATLAMILLFSWPMLPLSIPIYSHEKIAAYTENIAAFTNRWEDGEIHNLPQDYADMIGWEELASEVIAVYRSLPDSEQANCAIFATEYCTAGAILFYGRGEGLPEPVSFSDNFLLWAPDCIHAEVLIYVNDEPGDIQWLFENYGIAAEVKNEYFREDGEKVFVCRNPTEAFEPFYREKVADLKGRYH